MSEPATRPAAGGDAVSPDHRSPHDPASDDVPPLDPVAVDRAYLKERARRRARIERSRAQRRASLRFWLVLLALLVAIVLVSLTIWHEIQRLFGL